MLWREYSKQIWFWPRCYSAARHDLLLAAYIRCVFVSCVSAAQHSSVVCRPEVSVLCCAGAKPGYWMHSTGCVLSLHLFSTNYSSRLTLSDNLKGRSQTHSVSCDMYIAVQVSNYCCWVHSNCCSLATTTFHQANFCYSTHQTLA